jgi:hypothetical protein
VAPSLQKSAARVNGSALIHPDRNPDYDGLGKKKAPAIARRRLKFVDDGWRVSATHLRTS